jgi:response regulator RpfG family c-di-GMP phosphodiesterase
LNSDVAGIATTSADALDMIGTEPIDAVILDVSLHDGTSEAVAAELQRKHIPYFLISGWPDQEQLPPPLNRGRMLLKPYREEDLVSNLEHLSRMADRKPAGDGPRSLQLSEHYG